MANNKLKNMLKKLFENKEFEMTFTDAWDTWDGYDYVTDDIVYEFKFRVVVRSVVGEGSDAVGDMDIIIDSITKDGKDHYHNWADNGYNDTTWYIKELDNRFYLDYLEGLPFDVYSTIYGHDENRTKKDTIDESVIKRIVREDQPNTVKINMGNNKLKKLLKKLFENKEFEMTLTDTEDVYDGYNNVTQDIIYEFKFHVVVRRVVGEGSDAVGDLDIIVDSITKNGKDHYQYWADNGYKITWYINDLDEKFYFDYLEILPFDVDSTVYGHDEKRKGDIDESVIKRVIKEAVMDKFIDTVIPQLNNLKRKSNHSARMYGSNTIYYDKSDGQYYFRVSEPRRVMVWSDDSNFWSDDSNYNDDKVDWVTKPKTLYILTDLYREITEFIPNDEMILKWFNEKYKENAEEIQVRHSLKER